MLYHDLSISIMIYRDLSISIRRHDCITHQVDWAVLCSWSRSGQYLLASSLDWDLSLWDIVTGEVVQQVRLNSPILHSTLHPRNKYVGCDSLSLMTLHLC